jgi:hypothetical protein
MPSHPEESTSSENTTMPHSLWMPRTTRKENKLITLAEQIAEAQRELALRRKMYPQWVKSGKLDAGDAKYQLQVQEAIVRTLMRLDAEQRQLSLFAAQASDGPERVQKET